MKTDIVIIVHTYASSFLKVVMEKKSAVAVKKQLLKIMDKSCNNESLKISLNNPTLGPLEKISLLEKELSKDLHPLVLNLLKTLEKYNRMGFLLAIIRAYLVLEAIQSGLIPIKFITCEPINQTKQKDLIEHFSNAFDAKIMPNFSIDSALLGGLKIYAGDFLIDNSWSHKLSLLTQHIEGTTA